MRQFGSLDSRGLVRGQWSWQDPSNLAYRMNLDDLRLRRALDLNSQCLLLRGLLFRSMKLLSHERHRSFSNFLPYRWCQQDRSDSLPWFYCSFVLIYVTCSSDNLFFCPYDCE